MLDMLSWSVEDFKHVFVKEIQNGRQDLYDNSE